MTPTIDVGETDKELTVEAELPGVDEKDGVLTITLPKPPEVKAKVKETAIGK